MTATKDDGTVQAPARVLIEPSELLLIVPRCPPEQVFEHCKALSLAFLEADATTVTRAAAILGQVAHETDELRAMEEYASGEAYEGRASLGNSEPGDGRRFKGRGYFQLTGRDNYRRYGEALGLDLLGHPELAATPGVAALLAARYWTGRGLNDMADAFAFRSISKAINGPACTTHEQRTAYYQRALEVLGRSARL